MNYSRELTREEIEKINRTNTKDLIGQVVKNGNIYVALNELGEDQEWFDKNPVEELDKFGVPGAYRYINPPSGFTGYSWYITDGKGCLGMDDYANFCFTNHMDALKFYTKGLAERFKDKIEQLCNPELELKVVFDEDYHW